MNRLRYIITLVVIIVSIQALRGEERGVSFELHFPPGSDVLEESYYTNRRELEDVKTFIRANRYRILREESHIVLVSYIDESDRGNLFALNRASILASVVRAYLKVKYKFSNSNFAFYVCYGKGKRDLVGVEYRPYSIHYTDNKEIFYTLNPTYENLLITMSRYRQVPEMKPGKEPQSQIQTQAYPQQILVQNSPIKDSITPPKEVKQDSKTVSNVEIVKAQDVVLTEKIEQKKELKEGKKSFVPLLGLKSNLLRFVGLSLDEKERKLIYNIAGELYVGSFISVVAEGFIRPVTGSTKEDSGWWNVSGASGELRFWPLSKKVFRGPYIGLYGSFGDYDIWDDKMGEKGMTGDYYAAGMSIGYVQKIAGNLYIEGGIRGGYRQDRYDTYFVREEGYFQSESLEKKGFGIFDFNLSLLYRIGFKY